MNSVEIDIQIASSQANIPEASDLIVWSEAALEKKHAEITIRIVDEVESSQLNHTYRKKEGPTNVLSFLMTSPCTQGMLLGDIIICAPIVIKEAIEQHKSLKDHWAHLTIHGILHLQGYDHTNEDDAKKMEAKEIGILSKLGMANPYE